MTVNRPGFDKQNSARLGTSQNVAFAAAGGASAASSNFGSQTYQIRLSVALGAVATVGTAGVRYVVSNNTPVATASSTFLQYNIVEYVTVTPGQQVGVISNDASTGNLSVTECS